MKIEFVEFYPIETKKKSNLLGTVHLYLIEEEMDLRGILVFKAPKGYFYKLPHFKTFDLEEKKMVFYPHVRFTNEEKHKELVSFLQKDVSDAINSHFKARGGENDGKVIPIRPKREKAQQKPNKEVSSN